MGGTYGLDASVKKGNVFTVKNMKDSYEAARASHIASYDGSRGDGIVAMKSVDDMYVPPRNRVFSTMKDTDVSIGSYTGSIASISASNSDNKSFSTMLPELTSMSIVSNAKSRMSSRRSSEFSFGDASGGLNDQSSLDFDDVVETETANTPSTRDSFNVDYPFFINGGRKVIAQGCVLPPGVRIRHPSLLFGKKFVKQIKVSAAAATAGGGGCLFYFVPACL